MEAAEKKWYRTGGSRFRNLLGGGWGGDKHPDNISEDISNSEAPTKQVAELTTAAVRAVKQVTEKGIKWVCIQTDSMYVIKGITNWIDNWIKNGWKTSQDTEVKHKVLWEELHECCQKVEVTWKHVKGHASNPANEAADKLSKMATEKGKEVKDEKISKTRPMSISKETRSHQIITNISEQIRNTGRWADVGV